MRNGLHRTLVIVSATALAALLVTQIIWFTKAYRLEEQQFDQKVNLALREVADELLEEQRDRSTPIPPVTEVASNAYGLDLNFPVLYVKVDSLVRKALARQQIDMPYMLTVRDFQFDAIILGYRYDNATTADTAACITRADQPIPIKLLLTFPEKQANILAAHSFWVISAIVFTIIVLLGSYVIFDLRRQHRITLMKNEFINNMTHELNTPIANISMASEVLRSDRTWDQRDKVRRYVEIIHEENLRLKLHVEQVLRTTQLEKGELAFQRERVDVNALLVDIVRQFSPRVKIKEGQIISRLQAINAIVVGDTFHLRNMFSNLLDNAEKYSPLHPEITIETTNVENAIEVRVIDKGVGISRDAQPHVFEKFYRASTGLRHDIKGFGLGLTYVQQIVKAHGGNVDMESEVEKGSCFRICLPTT
jgi:two-component system, OmpR family, phosphate regulon sensor histidine kinase PhoR